MFGGYVDYAAKTAAREGQALVGSAAAQARGLPLLAADSPIVAALWRRTRSSANCEQKPDVLIDLSRPFVDAAPAQEAQREACWPSADLGKDSGVRW